MAASPASALTKANSKVAASFTFILIWPNAPLRPLLAVFVGT